MSWLHRMQQRLSITRNEALTLLSLSLFLFLGISARYVCRHVQAVSPESYAEVDRLFAERAAAVLEPPEAALLPNSSEAAADSSRSNGPPRNPTAKNTPKSDPSPLNLRVNLNTATAEDLEKLPRIGPKTAERILAFRAAYGRLRSVDDLLSVSGIGPKTLEQLRPFVYVAADSAR